MQRIIKGEKVTFCALKNYGLLSSGAGKLVCQTGFEEALDSDKFGSCIHASGACSKMKRADNLLQLYFLYPVLFITSYTQRVLVGWSVGWLQKNVTLKEKLKINSSYPLGKYHRYQI